VSEPTPEAVDLDEQGRPQPPVAGPEAQTLLGFLEYQRATFAWKTAGLDAVGLSTTVGTSDMTLGGMLKHLAYVEDHWFSYVLLGDERCAPWRAVDWTADPDWDWHSAVGDTPEELRMLWQQSVDRARVTTSRALTEGGMDRRARRTPGWSDRPPAVRWIVVHMIEEYARHNGHADLIREAVDGLVGE